MCPNPSILSVRSISKDFNMPYKMLEFFSDELVALSDIKNVVCQLSETHFEDVRLFIKDKLSTDVFKTMMLNNKPKSEETVEDWAYRIFKDQPFAIVINEAEAVDDKLSRKLVPFLDEFLSKYGYPVGGLELGVFIGNYGYTPFGVHHDREIEGFFHFFLGPNTKRMYYWTEEEYLKANGGSLEFNKDPVSILESASTFELKPGDLFYMPGNGFHIGDSPKLSIAVVLISRRYGSIHLTRDIIRLLGDELTSAENRREMPCKIPYTTDLPEIPQGFVHESLPPFAQDVRLCDYIDEKVRMVERQRFSNYGLVPSAKRADVPEREIREQTIASVKGFTIYVDRSELSESIRILARGHSLQTKDHVLLKSLIGELNRGQAIHLPEWFEDAEAAGVEEAAAELIAFLYLVQGVDLINS